VHHPCYHIYPSPGAGGVEALDCIITVKGVKEQETCLGVVLWACQSVYEDEAHNGNRCPSCSSNSLSCSHHWLEITLVNTSLREEDSIIIDHHKDMMERLVRCLIFPPVKANRSQNSSNLNNHCVFITILGIN
jgi:hypothetical protein